MCDDKHACVVKCKRGKRGRTGERGATGSVGATGPTGGGSRGVTGSVGATGATGSVGATGSQGVTGSVGATGSQGPPASVLGFSRFYGLTAGTGNLTTTDYAATIAAGSPVPFPRTTVATGGIVPATTTSFILPEPGAYFVQFVVHTTEPGQLQLALDEGSGPIPLPDSTVGNQNPTSGGHLFNGNDYVTTTVINALLSVINPSGNTPALTITPASGSSTQANAQSLTIQRMV